MPDDVSEDEKTRRIVELQALQRRIQLALHEAAVGTVVDELDDSASRRTVGELSGRTSGNTLVNVQLPADTSHHGPDGVEVQGTPSRWIGRTVPVRILRAGPHSLRGELMAHA
jgi:tRNA-2-methylthio-N6-dimethylallyladenosine synthase